MNFSVSNPRTLLFLWQKIVRSEHSEGSAKSAICVWV